MTTVDDGEMLEQLGRATERRAEALDDRITYLRADVEKGLAGLRRDVARLVLVWVTASAVICLLTVAAALLLGE